MLFGCHSNIYTLARKIWLYIFVFKLHHFVECTNNAGMFRVVNFEDSPIVQEDLE